MSEYIIGEAKEYWGDGEPVEEGEIASADQRELEHRLEKCVGWVLEWRLGWGGGKAMVGLSVGQWTGVGMDARFGTRSPAAQEIGGDRVVIR